MAVGRKVLFFAAILLFLTVLNSCALRKSSWGIELYDNGNCVLYNGKSYTVYSGMTANEKGKLIGVSDGVNMVRQEFYEIPGIDSGVFIAEHFEGMAVLSVYREINTPRIPLSDFEPQRLKIEVNQTMTEDADFLRNLTEFVSSTHPIGKEAERRLYDEEMSTQKHWLTLELTSAKYPGLVYILSYYLSEDGSIYVRDYSTEDLGITYAAGDLFNGLDLTID